MFDVSALAQHATVPAQLPAPLFPACMRLLRAISGRDHRYAEAHRQTSRNERAGNRGGRATRLSRAAALAEASACELAAEAR